MKFSLPGKNFAVKSNCCKNIIHRCNFPSLFPVYRNRFSRFRWSVNTVKCLGSRYRIHFFNAQTIATSSFSLACHFSSDSLNLRDINSIGSRYPLPKFCNSTAPMAFSLASVCTKNGFWISGCRSSFASDTARNIAL